MNVSRRDLAAHDGFAEAEAGVDDHLATLASGDSP